MWNSEYWNVLNRVKCSESRAGNIEQKVRYRLIAIETFCIFWRFIILYSWDHLLQGSTYPVQKESSLFERISLTICRCLGKVLFPPTPWIMSTTVGSAQANSYLRSFTNTLKKLFKSNSIKLLSGFRYYDKPSIYYQLGNRKLHQDDYE